LTGIAFFGPSSSFINKNSNFVLKAEERVALSAFEIRLWLHHFVQRELSREGDFMQSPHEMMHCPY
jgi:hypothetical protein